MKQNQHIRKLQQWMDDWCLFAEEAAGVILDDEQKEVLRSVQHNKMTSVASGSARGKDFIASVSAMCFFYLAPKYINGRPESTKIVCTAPTERQIKNIMIPEIAKIFHKLKENGISPFNARLTAFDIRTDLEDYFLTGFKADEYSHEAWSGFHAANVMFVVTEATAIAETVYNAIENNLQGNSRLLLVYNPNIPTGYAAESYTSNRFKSFRLDSLNAPNVVHKKMIIPGQVDYEWVKDKVQAWCERIPDVNFDETQGDFRFEIDGNEYTYRPNDLFRVKVRGLFPKTSTDVLVPLEWIEAANRRWEEFNESDIKDPLRLGVDVAGMGRDSSAFCFRYGDYVRNFEMFQSKGSASHMEVVGKIKHYLQPKMVQVYNRRDGFSDMAKTYPSAFIDTIGEGAGVYSRLKEQGLARAFSSKFSEKAEYRGKVLKDKNNVYEFLNMRAYVYWSIRDWLNPANKTKAMLPKDNELAQELMETKWEFLSDGRIKIEAKDEIKKKIKRSPDKADSLALTFYPVKDHDEAAEQRHRNFLNSTWW